MLTERKSSKVLSVFALVMINVIAVDSIRTLPMSAEYGFSAVFYYLLAGIVFFIPTALVSAELATGWPETGGVYVWVREAFGKKCGFLTIWLQWFYNICWYPTIMSLIAATIAYLFNPELVNNRLYMLSMILVIFWLTTLSNLKGMKVSSWLSNISAIAGTLLPMLFIIILGVIWLLLGKPIQISFSIKSFLPDVTSIQNLVLLVAVLYGLVGMEMSAAHAKEVKDPSRDYPRALFFSTIIILGSLIFATLAISMVIPQKDLNLVAGTLQGFSYFFNAFHLQWLTPVIALLIIVGAIGGASAWIIGPAKGLLVATQDGSLPAIFNKTTRDHVPVTILILQGVIFTVLSLAFILMPSVNSAFWLLTDVTAILALFVYVFMFSAAIYLRFKYPDVKRSFKIPGGKLGMIIVAGLGLVSTVFAIIVGFFPPSQIPVGSLFTYEFLLIAGVLVGCLLPFGIYAWQQRKKQGCC